jgi:hypothetical protein
MAVQVIHVVEFLGSGYFMALTFVATGKTAPILDLRGLFASGCE